MKKNYKNNNIEHIENSLASFKANESLFLSNSEKENILQSVFDRAAGEKEYKSIPSPFTSYKTHITNYFRYAIPLVILIALGTQLTSVFVEKTKVSLSDLEQVKSSLDNIQRDTALKTQVSQNREAIAELKTNTNPKDTFRLAAQVSTRSQEIRNQVAALMDENKVVEAKKIALDLEMALKADELYKVATSVEQEVFKAIDLRLDIEKQEANNASATDAITLDKRIKDARKEFSDFASSTVAREDNIKDADNAITAAEAYFKAGDTEKAIISLQTYDRILAEVNNILLP